MITFFEISEPSSQFEIAGTVKTLKLNSIQSSTKANFSSLDKLLSAIIKASAPTERRIIDVFLLEFKIGKSKILFEVFWFSLSIKPMILNRKGLSMIKAFNTEIALASEP